MRGAHPKEREDVNLIITQCERLVSVRGHSTAQSGMYEVPPFGVFVRREDNAMVVLVNYREEEVMRADWSSASEPGHFFIKPGAWRAEFLRLQAFDS